VAKETVTASWSPAHLNFADNFDFFWPNLLRRAHAFLGIVPIVLLRLAVLTSYRFSSGENKVQEQLL
jgi:DMSO/TMAO reductase YedYZ heme-binding membrane subunit